MSPPYLELAMEHSEASSGECEIKICGCLREVTVAFFELLIRGTAFVSGVI
jgi:hypothetical protein